MKVPIYLFCGETVLSHVQHDAEVFVRWREKPLSVTHCARGHTPRSRFKRSGAARCLNTHRSPCARAGKMGNCIVPYCDGPQSTNIRFSLPGVCFVWQTAMIILFGVFVRYNKEADAHWVEFKTEKNITDIENDFYFRYPSKSSLELFKC